MRKICFFVMLVIVLTMFTTILYAQEYTIIQVSLGNYGDHWVQLQHGAQSMAEELGCEYSLMSAEMDYDKEVTLLQNAVTMKPDAIFLDHGNGEALTPIVEKAVEAGIKVVAFDTIVPVKGLVSTINQDDYMLGYLSAKQMALDINGEGNIVVCSFEGASPIMRRKKALALILDYFPKLNVIAEFGPVAQNTLTVTMDQMDAILTSNPNEGDIAAVWAPWDQWALGCAKAIEAKGRNIPVYGIDISPYDLQEIAKEGSVWKATVACDPREIGRVAIRYLVLALMGEKVPQYTMMSGALINQEIARSIPEGSFITKDIIPEWGESGLGWTDELKEKAGLK